MEKRKKDNHAQVRASSSASSTYNLASEARPALDQISEMAIGHGDFKVKEPANLPKPTNLSKNGRFEPAIDPEIVECERCGTVYPLDYKCDTSDQINFLINKGKAQRTQEILDFIKDEKESWIKAKKKCEENGQNNTYALAGITVCEDILKRVEDLQ